MMMMMFCHVPNGDYYAIYNTVMYVNGSVVMTDRTEERNTMMCLTVLPF